MSDTFLFSFGVLVVAVGFYDFLRTTISLSGSGPVSNLLIYFLWRHARRFAAWNERSYGLKIDGFIGPAILSTIACFWITLHLIGYTLMYWPDHSLVNSKTGMSATLPETFAFVGSAFSTLGASRVSPTNEWWDLLSMVVAVNGMILLTLSVSFILSILGTTAKARAIAIRYRAVTAVSDKSAPAEIVRRLTPLGPELCQVTVELTVSPFPALFAPDDPRMNFPNVVAELCELLKQTQSIETPRQWDDPGTVELWTAMQVLGKHANIRQQNGLEAARQWACEHSITYQ